jgi:hypothetical protein
MISNDDHGGLQSERGTLALCHFIEKHISHRGHRVAEIVIEPQDAKDSCTICWSCPGETTATTVSLGKQD